MIYPFLDLVDNIRKNLLYGNLANFVGCKMSKRGKITRTLHFVNSCLQQFAEYEHFISGALQKPLRLGHSHASMAATFAYRVLRGRRLRPRSKGAKPLSALGLQPLADASCSPQCVRDGSPKGREGRWFSALGPLGGKTVA